MDRFVEIADGFWNIRGSFKLLGLFDAGTQTSLVRLSGGGYVLLDAYRASGEADRELLARTDQGREIRAVLNLHPFHTLHVRAVAQQFPHARLYGTRRHKALAPELPWEALHTDDPALHALFADDFRFSVPRGVDLVPSSDRLHFSSVLVLHRATGTLHVDDTLTWMNVPLFGGLRFHPTLRFALHKRPGAAAEFRAWAEELLELCGDVKHICTAHARPLPPADQSAVERVRGALGHVAKRLDAHERRYG